MVKIGKNEYLILITIRRKSVIGDVAFKNLSKSSGVPMKSLKRSMKSLIKKKLVTRVKKRKSVAYCLTNKGMRYV